MTDPAERRSLVPRGTFDPSQPARDTEPDPVDAPLRSYIDELRTRVDSLPELDDALMVPPDAAPQRPWVAADIESALHAAAETVPRSPSSPDAPGAALAPSTLDVIVPPADLAPRHIRRPTREQVDDFPVELDDKAQTLRTRDRGRKSGRFTSPAGLRAALEEGSIAAAVMGLVDAERAAAARSEDAQETTSPAVSEASTLAATSDAGMPAAIAATISESRPMSAPVVSEATHAVIEEVAAATPSVVATVARVIGLFAAASVAGGTAVYFLLHG